MTRKIEDKQESIVYQGKSMSITVYRNILKKTVSISLFIREKGTLNSLSKDVLFELYDLLKELKVEDLEVK